MAFICLICVFEEEVRKTVWEMQMWLKYINPISLTNVYSL